MRSQDTEAVPLACVPGAIPAGERMAHFALARRLFGELVEAREPVAGGYAFRFAPAALEAVARFVANERKCCPFLTFTVEAAPRKGRSGCASPVRRAPPPFSKPSFASREISHEPADERR